MSPHAKGGGRNAIRHMELSCVVLGRRLYRGPVSCCRLAPSLRSAQGVKALSGLLMAGTTAIAFSTDPSRRSDDQTSNSSADASQRLGRIRPAGWRAACLGHRSGRPFSSGRGRARVSQSGEQRSACRRAGHQPGTGPGVRTRFKHQAVGRSPPGQRRRQGRAEQRSGDRHQVLREHQPDQQRPGGHGHVGALDRDMEPRASGGLLGDRGDLQQAGKHDLGPGGHPGREAQRADRPVLAHDHQGPQCVVRRQAVHGAKQPGHGARE